jgi:hypothetical protein
LDARQLSLCAASMAVMAYEAAEAPGVLPRAPGNSRK